MYSTPDLQVVSQLSNNATLAKFKGSYDRLFAAVRQVRSMCAVLANRLPSGTTRPPLTRDAAVSRQ